MTDVAAGLGIADVVVLETADVAVVVPERVDVAAVVPVVVVDRAVAVVVVVASRRRVLCRLFLFQEDGMTVFVGAQ